MWVDYVIVFLYFVLSLLLSLVILTVSLLAVVQTRDIEKVSAYECGFHPFEDARGEFDVRFYLVAILFLILDLEIMFLYPWVVIHKYCLLGMYETMIIFLGLLVLGFIYEWKKGALEWE